MRTFALLGHPVPAPLVRGGADIGEDAGAREEGGTRADGEQVLGWRVAVVAGADFADEVDLFLELYSAASSTWDNEDVELWCVVKGVRGLVELLAVEGASGLGPVHRAGSNRVQCFGEDGDGHVLFHEHGEDVEAVHGAGGVKDLEAFEEEEAERFRRRVGGHVERTVCGQS